MNGPLIDPMTGALAAVEHAQTNPQFRTPESLRAVLSMLSPELEAEFFSRVNKEARKCGLPTCEQMTLHRGGYCCKEHKAEHKLRLRVRDSEDLMLVSWKCSNHIQMEGGHSRECGHLFQTVEEKELINGVRSWTNMYAVCPVCLGELFKVDRVEKA